VGSREGKKNQKGENMGQQIGLKGKNFLNAEKMWNIAIGVG